MIIIYFNVIDFIVSLNTFLIFIFSRYNSYRLFNNKGLILMKKERIAIIEGVRTPFCKVGTAFSQFQRMT